MHNISGFNMLPCIRTDVREGKHSSHVTVMRTHLRNGQISYICTFRVVFLRHGDFRFHCDMLQSFRHTQKHDAEDNC